MKKLHILSIAALSLFIACTKQGDKFTGLWNKDLNMTYDTIAYVSWIEGGAIIPVDRKVLSSPIFIAIWKEGEFYKLSGYTFDIDKKLLREEALNPGNARFRKQDDSTLVFDSKEYEYKLSIHFHDNTEKISLSIPQVRVEKPDNGMANEGYEMGSAHFKTMFNSGFHQIMDMDRKLEASAIQKLLEEKKIILK